MSYYYDARGRPGLYLDILVDWEEPCPATLRSEAPEFEPESSPADSAPSVPLWLPEGGA